MPFAFAFALLLAFALAFGKALGTAAAFAFPFAFALALAFALDLAFGESIAFFGLLPRFLGRASAVATFWACCVTVTSTCHNTTKHDAKLHLHTLSVEIVWNQPNR